MITPQNLSFYKKNNLAIAQMNQQKQQNQGQYKINEYLSKRKEVESMKMWMVKSLDGIAKQNTSLHKLFTQQQLVLNACISELLRQISLECKDRADLIQTIWNNHVEVATKVVEFYSKENNKVEWDTINQIKQLHTRYRDELKLSQKYYEENNSKYITNKNQLEIIIKKYRMEKKLNKRLQKLCNALKNEKQTINNLYCETSKEYIQAMINTGKLPQEQENYLLQQYMEATKGLLSRKLDFKRIKESIQLKDQTQKESELFMQQIVQGKTPVDSDESADDDEDIKQMFQRRRIRFEEKATQVEEIKKISQETETEYNKFMASKGIQVILNPKKSIEIQTENQVFEQQTQTDPKQLKNQFVQTDMTAIKGEDFEKLKTVYLKKLKVDPTSNKQLEIDGQQSEEFDSNYLFYQENKDQKRTSLEELNIPSISKYQISQQKKQSLKKSRVSLFSMSSLLKSPSQAVANETQESIPELKIDENQDNHYEFESQKKLKIFLKKIQDYTKFVKIDTRNPKQNITNFVEVTRETLKQFESLSSEIKLRLELLQSKQINSQIKMVEQAMESDELRNLLAVKDLQIQELLKDKKKINNILDELNLSTEDEDLNISPSAKNILTPKHEGRQKNISSSSFGIIQIKEPFQHHQNVQNMINENENQRKQVTQIKKRASIMLNMLHNQKDITSPILQSQQNSSFSNLNESLKAKNLVQQRRQSQIVSQIFNLASTPAQNNQMNISQGINLNIDQKKYIENKKSIQKIKKIVKGNTANMNFSQNYLSLDNLIKQIIQDSETFQAVEQLQQHSNKIQTFNQETIAHKNTVIQIRKMLQSIYQEFIQNLKKEQKLNQPLCILLRDFFTGNSANSKTTSISKIKKIAEKCQIIPKSYEEIQMFNSLLGICRSNQEFYDQPEYLNIYLQMLYYLAVENQSGNSQIKVIHSQLKTNTTLIYKYLPSILSSYLPDKKVYDIVMHLLKPYISDNEINDRENLVDIPEPEEQEMQFIEISSYVLNQFKDHSLFIYKQYNPIFECVTLNDLERITEEQFMFIQKHFGFADSDKAAQNLFKFREASAKQQMDKQSFVGFCNRNQIIDDFKFKNITDNNQYDDLTSFDFEIIEKLDNLWNKQKQTLQKIFFETQAYKYIHRRLIMSIESFIRISKKSPQFRKYYKARSFLAYKLLKMEMRLFVEEQYMQNLCIPEQLILINKISQPILVNSQIKQIQRKQKVLKKAVSIVYKNAFDERKIEDSSDSSESHDSSNSQMSSQNLINKNSKKQSVESLKQNNQS
ncbi:hypothetical protein ABPG72_000087 [Tetrahymena utriculariae]